MLAVFDTIFVISAVISFSLPLISSYWNMVHSYFLTVGNLAKQNSLAPDLDSMDYFVIKLFIKSVTEPAREILKVKLILSTVIIQIHVDC